MTDRREADRTEAYLDVHRRIMSILYEEDPAAFGSSVGAPNDEYTEEATRLIVDLKGALTREDAHRIVSDMFPTASETLSGRLYEEWVRFAGRLRSA